MKPELPFHWRIKAKAARERGRRVRRRISLEVKDWVEMVAVVAVEERRGAWRWWLGMVVERERERERDGK